MPVSDLAQSRQQSRSPASFAGRHAFWLLVALFTVCYFARTMLRAAGKPFWFDEICTLYIVRLPTFGDSLAAVLHGAGYNPALFFIIHRAFRVVFGEGQLALRLPEILSFWVFCVCLFSFVSKRAGFSAGWIAMALPMATGAYSYATEARPHGLILGFLGIALVCWQRMQETPRSWGWRIGFVLSLGAAYFTHCYAVLLVIPFGLTELWFTLRHKTIRWLEWLTLFLPAMAAVISYMPLLRSYRTVLNSAAASAFYAAKLNEIPGFYAFILAPCWVIVVAVIAMQLFRKDSREQAAVENARVASARPSSQEIALILSFLSLPVFGVLIAIAMHGPMFLRYLLGGTAGCVLALAFGSVSRSYPRAAAAIAVLLGLYLYAHLAETVRLRFKGLTDPLESYPDFRNIPEEQPIVVHNVLAFNYLIFYAPQLRRRLYSVSYSKKDSTHQLNKAVREWCHIPMNREQTVDEFVAAHPEFEFHGAPSDYHQIPFLLGRSEHTALGDFQLEEYNYFLAHIRVSSH